MSNNNPTLQTRIDQIEETLVQIQKKLDTHLEQTSAIIISRITEEIRKNNKEVLEITSQIKKSSERPIEIRASTNPNIGYG